MIIMLTVLLLGQLSTAPQWRDRAIYEPSSWWYAQNVTHELFVAAQSNFDALAKLSILDPQGDWRKFAKALLARKDFNEKALTAALLARHGDFSGWQEAREEFLFRIATEQGQQWVPTLWTFWKMTTKDDPQPGAAVRELLRMALELKPKDGTLVRRRIENFDPEGWMRR